MARLSRNSISDWLVPSKIQEVTRQAVNSFKREAKEHHSSFMRNNYFHNIHKGKRCFILATGPSINKYDLTLIKDELAISVNHFYLHEKILEISPQYHVIPPNHHPFKFDLYEKHFQAFENKCGFYDACFFGYTPYSHSIFEFLGRNPKRVREKNYFINYTASTQLDENNHLSDRLWDICGIPFAIRSVVYSAIQIAVYMGCKQIYLLGTDYNMISFLERSDNPHFYDSCHDLKNAPRSTEDVLLGYYLTWKHYRLMKQYLAYRRVEVYNASLGSMLDVFPKVNLSDILR